jgi:HPt (histidine-containing phosphotransfer) domain-containing protein
MTAHARIEERQRCLDAGMNDHVSKPIDPDALFSTLLRWAKPKSMVAPDSTAALPTRLDEMLPPRIPGINLADGMKRLAGNRQLYRKLLSQFAAKQLDSAAQISVALESGDRSLAERIAHTVKGVAGNLGISDVQSAAERLEKVLHEGSDSVPAVLDQFAIALRVQVAAIEQALNRSVAETPAEVPMAPFNREKAKVAIGRLKQLLQASDGDAQDAFETLRAVIEGFVEKPYLDALSESINNFDFEVAQMSLDELAGRLQEK